MHVVIDGRAIKNELDGIGRFSINVIGEIVSSSPDISFSILIRENLAHDLCERIPSKARLITTNMGHLSAKGMFFIGKIVDNMKADIYHNLFMFLPFAMKTPSLITIYDLMWVKRPWDQASGKIFRQLIGWLFHKFFVTISIKSASQIIALSEATKKDILKYWRSISKKICVAGAGVDPCFSAPILPVGYLSVQSLFDLPENPYFIHISNSKPYKNTLRLLESYAQVAKETETDLIIIGRRSAFSHKIEECINKLNLRDRIYFLGSVRNKDLVQLMRSAKAMLFPSLYEGFGLPVIEAMASGCPVMTSNRGALLEAAGDSALLIDPTSVESMATGMKILLNDAKLCENLRKKGLERASQFKWSNVAQKIVNTYKSIMNNENTSLKSTL